MQAFWKSRSAVVQELKARGFKLQKTKFYKDCANGLCRVEPDGSVREASIEEYIANPLARLRKLDQPYLERKKRERQTQRAFLLIPFDFSSLSQIVSVLKGDKKGAGSPDSG